jgi:hypothetical protein
LIPCLDNSRSTSETLPHPILNHHWLVIVASYSCFNPLAVSKPFSFFQGELDSCFDLIVFIIVNHIWNISYMAYAPSLHSNHAKLGRTRLQQRHVYNHSKSPEYESGLACKIKHTKIRDRVKEIDELSSNIRKGAWGKSGLISNLLS